MRQLHLLRAELGLLQLGDERPLVALQLAEVHFGELNGGLLPRQRVLQRLALHLGRVGEIREVVLLGVEELHGAVLLLLHADESLRELRFRGDGLVDVALQLLVPRLRRKQLLRDGRRVESSKMLGERVKL